MSGNIIVFTITVLIIAAAAYSVYKNRKHGKCCGCDGNCSGSGCKK